MTTDSQHLVDLDLGPNEASGLLRVEHPDLLKQHGWDRAFWSVLDEVDVADCVALLGHRESEGLDAGWDIASLQVTRTGDQGEADDAEAVARHDGWVYLFGSQHGGKDGPIRRREQWVARFREADVTPENPSVDATVVRTPYVLHRIINEALHECAVDVVAMTDGMRAAYIEQTQEELAGTDEAERIHSTDWTINIEGADFTADGTLLAGLRFPVAADGRPLIVGLRGIERLFDGGKPEATQVWAVDAIGRDGTLAGVRDLCLVDDTLHLVTGNLDSKGKGSVIIEDYPGGADTVNSHFSTSLDGSGVDRPAELLREFPDHPRIEGIAEDGQGRFFYVSDENETVRLRCTPLLSGQ